MFVPVCLAWSKGAAQGGIKLFSTVHVQPNILLRRGTKKKRKEKRVQRTELAEVSWRLPRRESLYWNRRYEAICFVFPLATSLPAWKKWRENQCSRKSLTLRIHADQMTDSARFPQLWHLKVNRSCCSTTWKYSIYQEDET